MALIPETLETADVLSNTNCIFSRMWGNTYVFPQSAQSSSNYVSILNDGQGDQPITTRGVSSDGDYFFTVSWGTGFAVHEISNAGVLSAVYHDNTPNNSYAYYGSLALDKTRKVAYVANQVYDNIAQYDYSALFTGGAVSKGSTLTEAGNNLPSDEVGYAYLNGLCVVGDYLYIVPDEKATSTMMRWNVLTETADNLTVTRARSTANRYGTMTYDEANDRLYVMWYTYGSIWVVTDASTAGAECWQIDASTVGYSYHCYTLGVVVDKDDADHIWISSNRYIGEIDISNCITSGGSATPTVVVSKGVYLYDGPFHMMGVHSLRPHPDYGSDLLMWTADRGYGMLSPFVDKVNRVPIGCSITDTAVYDITPNTYAYGGNVSYKIQSDDGTNYYIAYGYGGSGSQFKVYAAAPELPSSWEITFGTYTLDANASVYAITVLQPTEYAMINTTLTYYVSNDNGTTWETATPDVAHTFSSSGYQIQLRLSATGDAKNTAHIINSGAINILLEDSPEAGSGKYLSTRLAGG